MLDPPSTCVSGLRTFSLSIHSDAHDHIPAVARVQEGLSYTPGDVGGLID